MCADLYAVASSPAIKRQKPARVLAALPKRLQWHSQPPTKPFFSNRNRPRCRKREERIARDDPDVASVASWETGTQGEGSVIYDYEYG